MVLRLRISRLLSRSWDKTYQTVLHKNNYHKSTPLQSAGKLIYCPKREHPPHPRHDTATEPTYNCIWCCYAAVLRHWYYKQKLRKDLDLRTFFHLNLWYPFILQNCMKVRAFSQIFSLALKITFNNRFLFALSATPTTPAHTVQWGDANSQ